MDSVYFTQLNAHQSIAWPASYEFGLDGSVAVHYDNSHMEIKLAIQSIQSIQSIDSTNDKIEMSIVIKDAPNGMRKDTIYRDLLRGLDGAHFSERHGLTYVAVVSKSDKETQSAIADALDGIFAKLTKVFDAFEEYNKIIDAMAYQSSGLPLELAQHIALSAHGTKFEYAANESHRQVSRALIF